MLDETFSLLLLSLKTVEKLVCVFALAADRMDDTRLDDIVGKTEALRKLIRETRENLEKDQPTVASINRGY